ncbi:Tyrosine--tRNA ligase [Candidatus Fokinia solitaria]|uniref:Tyrosine--tRNA ligase n=1 Tax=Candidatus Fokinia solitaria TaxID=1802984 RepID=A0A2U8BRG9_9RICK|nr:tyrosine--tRNA ligase [Candidatus Fokinia solitaria]AWD32929.1 Tyrosine--tRNA ligase [Candidatus Fokinia solitaria]
MNDLISFLQNRGFVYQSTDLNATRELFSNSVAAGYIGFDCTAKSLHIGSLVQLMLLSHVRNAGHNVIIVLGTATTMIGDPSDKTEMRRMMPYDEIVSNKRAIRANLLHFFGIDEDRDGVFHRQDKGDLIIVDNRDWLMDVKYVEFLRDYGKYVSINRMLSFEHVKRRLELDQPLSFLEFNYMLLQAYDFLELNKKYNCSVQFGGSEQWGNIVAGIELAKKVSGIDTMYGVTTPLITNSSGVKMGKTVDGAVWLNSDMKSSYDFWQFWRSVDDKDVRRFMQLYTYMSLEEISEVCNDNDINQQKVILANAVTTICHSAEEAEKAHEKASAIYEKKNFDDVQSFTVDFSRDKSIPLCNVMASTGITSSIGEAKRLISGGGVRINGIVVEDELHNLSKEDIATEKCIISIGKKRYFKLVAS